MLCHNLKLKTRFADVAGIGPVQSPLQFTFYSLREDQGLCNTDNNETEIVTACVLLQAPLQTDKQDTQSRYYHPVEHSGTTPHVHMFFPFTLIKTLTKQNCDHIFVCHTLPGKIKSTFNIYKTSVYSVLFHKSTPHAEFFH
ncbi:hypothetical protein ATANTOWER_013544 [Ataeniobius toweri]|uniref:Uncharacterized protein n=1 Tax=Ataeniobius toweri TaxID=208326 RepID=A0ABU7A7G4_9TELE|nr:hypothetical protein [Ataeniobius toweri]